MGPKYVPVSNSNIKFPLSSYPTIRGRGTGGGAGRGGGAGGGVSIYIVITKIQ
jgi:hypothetical protein